MGRYQYRYWKYRHIRTLFSIGSIGIGNQKRLPLFSNSVGIGNIGVSEEVNIGISAKMWYRPIPSDMHQYIQERLSPGAQMPLEEVHTLTHRTDFISSTTDAGGNNMRTFGPNSGSKYQLGIGMLTQRK